MEEALVPYLQRRLQAAKKQFGYELDKKKMHLPEPIRSLGTYNVPIRLHQKVTAEIKVHVSEK